MLEPDQVTGPGHRDALAAVGAALIEAVGVLGG
jgi:hypothetical protein